MSCEKIVICEKCGAVIVGADQRETFIRNRILKFKGDGTPYAICSGSMGAGRPCKNKVIISKDTLLSLMKEASAVCV